MNSLLDINEVNNATKELETVPKDNSVKLPSTSITSRPPVIVEGVPSTTQSPVMVGTILFDNVSQVSMLRDELKFQRKEQQKVT